MVDLLLIKETDMTGLQSGLRPRFSMLPLPAYLLALALAALLLAPAPVQAQTTCTVMTLADDGSAGTLRSRIADEDCLVIDFDPGIVPGTITLDAANGHLLVARDLTIAGPGAGELAISGGNVVRVLLVTDAVTDATISAVTISEGRELEGDSPQGGGVFNAGVLTIRDSAISGNQAQGGGGIANVGTLTITNTGISANHATSGGGVFNNSGDLFITNSTISSNTANWGGGIYNFFTLATAVVSDSTVTENIGWHEGGGIYNFNGVLEVTGSTISGNLAGFDGGGVWNNRTAEVRNSTISGNSASEGGGVYNTGGGFGDLQVRHGTVVFNTAAVSSSGAGIHNVGSSSALLLDTLVAGHFPGQNCNENVEVGDNFHNLVDDQTCGEWFFSPCCLPVFSRQGFTTVPFSALHVGPLADNGGPTMTHALLPDSVAINHAVFCELAFDQRGVSRPQGPACDAGAFELEAVALSITTETLPGGTEGEPYSASLAATGGMPNYAWAVIEGSLPSGLELDASTGEISGTPSEEDTFTFTIQVTDSGEPPQSESRELTLVVAPAEDVAGPDPDPSVLRYAGATRFETAAEISKSDFPDPAAVSTVFVAVGSNFPDALAGAAAAAQLGAPLLLVNTDSIPPATATELSRLDPDEIVVLGGEAVISPAVATGLGAFGAVTRLAGPNRFATAVEISKWAFDDPGAVEEVVIATGANFPDALGGGPVAVAVGGPVLLVQPDALPAVVRAEIERLAPVRITVLGGPAAISDAVVTELNAIAETTRVAGANRYATAIEASKHGFDGSGRVYVAVGTNFPDALAGAAAAGFFDAPVLLVPSNMLPAEVAAEITRVGAHTVIILGGTAVVSAAVEAALKNLLGA